MFKEHEGIKKTVRRDVDDGSDDEDEDGEANNSDLDEDNAEDAILADKAMFVWLKQHYGSEIPDDQFNDDYDYSELEKEIKEQEKNKYKQLKKNGNEEEDH